MARTLTLILGGARSGKSRHAERLAAESGGDVLFVATAEALDEEMEARIAAHREDRPAGWETLEAEREVGASIRREEGEAAVVLLDCLTMLANNMFSEAAGADRDAQDKGERELRAEIDGLLAAYEESSAQWIVVSNEVGLGLVPAFPLGRAYRDALGRANQRLAAAADEVLFMVAGLPLVVKGSQSRHRSS